MDQTLVTLALFFQTALLLHAVPVPGTSKMVAGSCTYGRYSWVGRISSA